MTPATFVQRLLAIKILVDTLLADAAHQGDVPVSDVPAAAAPATGICRHPPGRRDYLGGFGAQSDKKKFRCDACGDTVRE